MKNIIQTKVYYADTDSYGVVWHGTYLRWLEQGRVEWCEQAGENLLKLQQQDILIPVVNLNIRYKSSAKLNNSIIITTEVEKYNKLKATFHQQIFSNDYKTKYIEAFVDVVATNSEGKLYRPMPEALLNIFGKEK